MQDGSDLIAIDAGQGRIAVRAKWIGSGWPQDVREVLEASDPSAPWPPDLILMARRFSPGALELVRARGANWADESGAAQIVAPGLFVSREASAKATGEREFGWSPSAEEIAELLLSRAWPEGFGTTEIANLTGWSAPQVSQVLQVFDEQGWSAKYGPRRGRGAKRELADLDGLLESWSAAVNEHVPVTREASASIADPMRFLEEDLAAALNEHVRWALGGWAAAQEAAPFTTTVPTLQIYVNEEDMTSALEKAMTETGLRDVSEGGRVQFLMAPSGVLGRTWTHGDLPLVSAARIYADLQLLGPRGAEVAEHLKEETIEPLHRPSREAGPPEGLVVWERETKARLQTRIKVSSNDDIQSRYQYGTYSASYRLQGASEIPSLPEFKTILREMVGRETGWPAWLVPERPRPYEDTIEVWFDDTVFNDPSHSDFWRADPNGRLGLIRGYDEDGEDSPVPRGSSIDLTLPIWRVGDPLLHAGRLATRLGATRIEFMMRWEGLAGRKLASYASRNWMVPGEYRCHQSAVVTYVQSSPARLETELADLVRSLVGPLYAAFEFFEPPAEIYDEELTRMRNRAR